MGNYVSLFPAVRAIGEGNGEKVFYLTAKTITRTVAEEAFSILQDHGLKFKVTQSRRKRNCVFCEKAECNPQHCEWAKGHFDRINDAVYDLWTSEDHYTVNLLEYAQKAGLSF